MQFSDKIRKQAHRVALMVALCDRAGATALQMLEQGEAFDIIRVFDLALQECLKHDNYDKDDLTTVWAMLQLGSRAIRRFSISTDHYDLGPSFDPPALVLDSRGDQSHN